MSEILNQVKASIDATGEAVKGFRGDIAALQERIEAVEAQRLAPGRASGTASKAQVEHVKAFGEWLRRPFDERVKAHLAQVEADAAGESKAVTIGSASGGGYAVPEEINRQIEHRVRQLNPFRGLVRTVSVGSSDYKHLVGMGDGASGWVGEGGTRSETTSPTLRERAPTMGTLYAYPKASEEAVQDIFFDVAQWLIDEASDDFAATEATAVISGDGTNKPTGFLNATPTNETDASVAREPTELQYIPLGNASAVTADGLYDLLYSIRERYLGDPDGVAWAMNRSTMAAVAKLKSAGSGDYLLSPALADRVRPQLLGYPVFTCDAMPAVAGNAYPIAFGNWRRGYLLVDRGPTRITVDENITTPGQVKFYVRRRVGGCVLNNDAIKVGKVSTT